MINDALDYIRREIRDYLSIDDAESILNHAHLLREQSSSKGVYLSLVNVEEEKTLKNTRYQVRLNDHSVYREPPVHLNLYVLFSFEFGNYSTNLLRLSETIECFQRKPVYTVDNQSGTNPFPTDLEKLIFDFYNLNFEQVNHLWGVLGGAYFPSVLYKVRMVRIQLDETIEAPQVTQIQVDTGMK